MLAAGVGRTPSVVGRALLWLLAAALVAKAVADLRRVAPVTAAGRTVVACLLPAALGLLADVATGGLPLAPFLLLAAVLVVSGFVLQFNDAAGRGFLLIVCGIAVGPVLLALVR